MFHKASVYLVCSCNPPSLRTGFSDSLKIQTSMSHTQKSNPARMKLLSPLGHKASVLYSKFQECNLKGKSWIKKSAGAYITQLYKSDVRNILHILLQGDHP